MHILEALICDFVGRLQVVPRGYTAGTLTLSALRDITAQGRQR